ncbi:hypothetical protein [Ornithinimicrobium cavernae]|uniref:hypothetical protein n=1 Tax=Ornithinimicrobium cavernae TaxID=2666047 RepID=UPI000D6920C6|nr:hypothetical protein [Ornithinimicrobium cavernae]
MDPDLTADGGELPDDDARLRVVIEGNDPRFTPTAVVTFETSSHGWDSESALDEVVEQIRVDHGWQMGYHHDYSHRRGGIGASGIELFTLTLGAIGSIPGIAYLYAKFNRRLPERPDRDLAWDTAMFAITDRYPEVVTAELTLRSEAAHEHRWAFELAWPSTGDLFEVSVVGGSDGGSTLTSLKWTNGDPFGPAPGVSSGEQGVTGEGDRQD